MLAARRGRTMRRMKPRSRLLLTCIAFAIALFGAFADGWNPLLTLQTELGLYDAVYARGTPRWIGAVLALPPFVTPILGMVLSVAAFGAALRRGHRPAVAPALAGVIAASVMLGVGGLLTWVTHLPYAPDGVLNGVLHAGWIAACVAPAVLLRLPFARLRRPVLALSALVVAFFIAATAAQYVEQRDTHGCRRWASACGGY